MRTWFEGRVRIVPVEARKCGFDKAHPIRMSIRDGMSIGFTVEEAEELSIQFGWAARQVRLTEEVK
jgi:hypothetical protein